MNFRVTAALLAVLIVLGGIVYYISQSPPPPAAGAAPTPASVLKLSSTDVTKLILTGGTNLTELDKDGNSWVIAKPTSGPADNGRVGGWVDQISNLSAERTIDDVSDLGSYGLVNPSLKVEVDLSTGAPLNLQFGDKTPDGASYYVNLPSDSTKAKSVFLVSAPLGDDLKGALTKPPVAIPTPTSLPTLVPSTITPPSLIQPLTATPTPGG
jgi:hypothetical protein